MIRGRALLLLGLASIAWLSVEWGPARAQEDELVERGADLFGASCSTCHGPGGEGSELGPSLVGVGAASADFQLSTGRMPLADPDLQGVRKPPAFSRPDIDALVAFVATLGDGPPVPEVDPNAGELSLGQALFSTNCAPCHGSTGTGGAVGSGAIAPSLHRSEPVQVAEAILSGPGQMPVFGFTEHEQNSVLAFVEHVQQAPSPGGADIGDIGSVPEGYVAWGIGTIAILLVTVFIGTAKAKSPGGRS